MTKNCMFEIRLASPSDAEAIHSITAEAFRRYCEMAGISDIEALHETVEDVKKDIAEKTVIVAYMDGEAVGSLRLRAEGETAYLSRFGVSAKRRGNGVGKALANAADTLARRMGAKTITLHTASRVGEIVRFYYSRGFYIRSVSDERGYLRAEMVKELGEEGL